MTGEDLLLALQAMTPEERALPVFYQSDYLDPVLELKIKRVAENWKEGGVALRDFWPEMENPRPALGSRVIVL